MAEKDKTEPDTKSGSRHRSFSQILFDEFVVAILVAKGLPWLWDTLKKFLTQNADLEVEKPNLMRIFAEAMNTLKADDRAAHDTIEHFMSAADGLNSATKDLEDFQLRTATIGGAEVGPTVTFLKTAAEPHSHAERKAFLGRYGIIGPRAIDAHEKVFNFINDTKNGVISAAKATGKGVAAIPGWVEPKIKNLGDRINTDIQDTGGEATLDRWIAKMQTKTKR